MTTTTYETTEGSEPSADVQHEPRTLRQTRHGVLMMMTEIEDGIFVGWDQCGKCAKPVDSCRCASGPSPSDIILRWRDERFENSIRHRRPVENTTEAEPAADVATVTPDQDEDLNLTREDITDVGF